MTNQSVLKDDIKTVVKGFPDYLVSYIGGFLVYILSNADITSIALFGVFAGLAIGSVWWGLMAFFGAYIIAKTIGTLGDAIVHASNIRSRIEAQKVQSVQDPSGSVKIIPKVDHSPTVPNADMLPTS